MFVMEILLIACIAAFCGPGVVLSVKITKIQVPELIYLKDDFWLNCTYDMESEMLYSVKWFKKNNEVREEGSWSEIYRYIPNQEEKKTIFPTTGVHIDLNRSSHGNVYMSTTDQLSYGTYKCEVSADAPTFETVREERETRTYYFLPHQPTIKGLKPQYIIGEYVNATCAMHHLDPKFKPMTKMVWFINNDPVPPGYVRESKQQRQIAIPNYPIRVLDPEIAGGGGGDPFDSPYDSSLSIKFLVNPNHFVDGAMKLRCTASSIPAFFTRSAEAVASLEPIRGASFPGRYSSDSAGSSTSCNRWWLLALMLSSISSCLTSRYNINNNHIFA